MVVAHVADGRDAHAARGLHVLEGGRAVVEPLRRHAVVAQVVEHLFRLLVARQLLEHPEVERGRAVQERAGVGVDAEGGRGPALRTELLRARRRPAASTAMNDEVEPTGRPTNGELHPAHALGAAVRLHLLGVGVVVGHEEVLAHGLHLGRCCDMPSGGEVSTMQCRPRGRRSRLGSCSTMPHVATRLRFCGWPRLPVRMRTSVAPRWRRMRSSRTALPSASGSPDPLREDVRAAAADRGRRAPQAGYAPWAWASRGRLRCAKRLPRMGPNGDHGRLRSGVWARPPAPTVVRLTGATPACCGRRCGRSRRACAGAAARARRSARPGGDGARSPAACAASASAARV